MFGFISKAKHEAIVAIYEERITAFEAALDRSLNNNISIKKASDAAIENYRTTDQAAMTRLAIDNGALRGRLAEIAAMETAGANATVKRMARVARGDQRVRDVQEVG